MADTRDEARLESVTARLKNSPDLEAAVRRAITEGRIPGATAQLPPGTADAVDRDADRLESLVPLDPLEAIVQRVGRPPMLVRNNAVELEDLPDFPVETDTKIKLAEQFVPSVGRVEFLNFSMAWGGTGWVIGEDGNSRFIVTNRHVAKLIARRTADGRGTFLRSPVTGVRYGANLDFNEEVGALPADAHPFSVVEIVYLADDTAPDIAVLRVVGDGLPQPLPLADDGPAGEGELVAVVGYPAFDIRNDLDDQARYFHDLFDVKRFAPGKVMQQLSGRTTLRHDCTTLGGNSGSPLISLNRNKIVGLHFAGLYGKENSAVGVSTLLDLLTSKFRPTATPVPRLREASTTEAADGDHAPGDLADRLGYEPDFLGDGFTAPWPGLPEAFISDLARPSDESQDKPGELRYTHFGVRFSASRRQPLMTAVNIDGSSLVQIKRSNDRWFRDGRIDRALQLGQSDYDNPQIDRGHMVRRQDPNWDPQAAGNGPSALATLANGDTFHYTNAAPQHSAMNQGKTLWLGLEDLILESARTHGFKACVFTGPVVGEDDPEIKDGLIAPLEFWKLAVMINADRRSLHATAYLLSQGDLIRKLLEKRSRAEANEGFVLGPYRTFQISIRDLADATGYDLSAYASADPLAPEHTDHEAMDFPRFIALERFSDVVL